MNIRDTIVKEPSGKEYPAQVAECEICGGDVFHIFVVNGHNHLQCANPACRETYCQGGCEEPPPKDEPPPEDPLCPQCGAYH